MSRTVDATLFLLLSVLWGLSFPAISVGLEHLPPLLFASFRYDVAAIVLLAYMVVRLDSWLPRGRNNHAAVVGGGLFLVAGNGLLFIGQQSVPSGVAAIMQALVPIATAVWAYLLLGERLSLVGAGGVVLGFVGIALVVQPSPGDLFAGDTLGRLIIVGQVMSVALGGVLVQQARPSVGRVVLTAWSMLLGAIVLHLVSLAFGEVLAPAALVPSAVAAVLYLGVFSTAIAFFIYFTFLENHGAFQAALVAYLVPVVATVVGVFVLEETIGLPTILGFALVALGFGLVKRRALAEAVGFTTGFGGH